MTKLKWEKGPQSLRFGDQSYRVYCLPETDSTNLRLRRWAEGEPPPGLEGPLEEGVCLAAGAQTAGRGRLGRSFLSPRSGLYFSLCLRGEDASTALEMTPAAACAVCEALEEMGFSALGIKWVNDLYYRGRKVCGILCERVGAYVICGIGINLSDPPGGFPPEAGMAGSLHRPDLKREDVLEKVLEKLAFYTDARNGERTRAAYRERQLLNGRFVRCDVGGSTVRGRVTGIGEDYSLQVATPEGWTRRVSSGEVTRVYPEEEQPGEIGLRTAFFDFDGTLRSGDSIVSFLKFAREKGKLSRRALLGAGVCALLGKAGLMSMEQVKTRALSFEKALSPAEREALLREFVARRLLPELFPRGLEAWRRLREEGYRMVLVTASTGEYMAPLSRALGADALLCTPMAPDGRVGPNCRGREKERRMLQWAESLPALIRVDWEGSRAFGDSAGDESMLRLVGSPCAVNPDRRLLRLARAGNWTVLNWAAPTGKKEENNLTERSVDQP